MAETEGLSAGTIMKGLCGLKDEELLFDIQLTAEGKTLSAHRNLLAAVSPFFKTMFKGSFKEAEEDTIELQDIKYEALRKIVNSIYTPGSLVLSTENVSDILAAANSFQIKEIVTQCENFMKKNLSPENCLLFLKLAEIYNLNDVISKSNEYLLAKFHSVSEYPNFKDMSKDALIAYLENDTLNPAGDETQVFHAVTGWLKHDDSRLADTYDVMSHVRFKTMKLDKLIDIAGHTLIDDNEECRALVRNALAYHGKMYEKPLVDEVQNRPRGKPGLFIMPSGTGSEWTNTLDNSPCILSLFDRKLHRLKIETRFVNLSMSLVRVNNFLFLFAVDSNGLLPITMRYDVSSGEWLKLAPVPRAGGCTYGSSAVEFAGNIFLINGKSRNGNLTEEVFKYEIASNEWTKVKNAPFRSYQSATTACDVNSCVYLSGGIMPHPNSGVQVHAAVAAYDVQADLWLTKPAMNYARAYHVMEAMKDRIYVLGGKTSTDADVGGQGVYQIEVHDILSEQWTIIEGQTLLKWGSTATIIDDNIFVVGGTSNVLGQREKLDINIFNTKEERLVSRNDLFLPEMMSFHVAAYLNLPQLL